MKEQYEDMWNEKSENEHQKDSIENEHKRIQLKMNKRIQLFIQ